MLDELAQLGLDNLLNYAFTAYKIPIEKQAGVKTLIAMRQLSDAGTAMTPAQRQKLIADIVKGIDIALPAMRDAKLMLRQASDLIKAGVDRDVNTLEYWGDNPTTQSQLRPIAQTVVALLTRCVEQATKAANDSANQIQSQDDKVAVSKYEQLDQLSREADFTRAMTQYDLVLAIDRADGRRRDIAAAAIESLKQYDTADQPVRARVRVRMGKLSLAIGDLPAARAMFDSIISPADANDFKPAPDVGLQYEARYFRCVADLADQKADDTQKGLDTLNDWQRGNLPSPDSATTPAAKEQAKAAQEGAKAASAILHYRILSLRAEQATNVGAKKRITDEAVAVLYDLLKTQPSFQATIYDQLMGKLDADEPMNRLDVLLLQALVRRGETEVRRTTGTPDRKSLERGLAAANELLARGPKKVEPSVADSASLLAAFFLDKLQRPQEAAAAFVDYIAKHPGSSSASLALDNAEGLIGQLRRDRPDDAQVTALYEQFLPIAIAPPFNHKEFAYEYARRLQLQSKPAAALDYFRQVPADDKRIVAAKFFQTVAEQQLLDETKPNDPKRPALVKEIQSLTEQVSQSIAAAIAAAPNEEARNNYRSMLVRSTLLAAELARQEQNDPQRAITLLAGFENTVRGLPDAGRRITDALLVRVQAYMSLNHYDDATNQLVQLLDREPARGGRIVYDLLQKLNDELDKAQAADNAEAVRSIARNRAQLTGFLVKWARTNSNPAIRKLAYGYAVFDAEVQRFAAAHEPDAATRTSGLEKALERFNALNVPVSVAEYKTTIPQPPAPPNAADAPTNEVTYDPAVILGIARTQFDLQHWTDARESFSRLLSDRRLGPAVSITDDHGIEREIDNENYWEAVLKLIQSNIALKSGVDESKNYLRQQIIRWGDRVGGKKFKGDFSKLRSELIPDFDPNATTQESRRSAVNGMALPLAALRITMRVGSR